MGRGARRAFTLMEVLVVIALFGAVVALVAVDFGALLENAARRSPLETLLAALDAGRERAANASGPVRLVFDGASGALRLTDGAYTAEFPMPDGAGVAFALPAESADGAERPLDAVVFHPSGYTTPARVELRVGGARSLYRLEPFSAHAEPEDAR